MSTLAAASMSGVRRLALLAAYYLMHLAILLGATMLWGTYAILVAVHPARRRKTAKFLGHRMSTHINIPTPYSTLLYICRETNLHQKQSSSEAIKHVKEHIRLWADLLTMQQNSSRPFNVHKPVAAARQKDYPDTSLPYVDRQRAARV